MEKKMTKERPILFSAPMVRAILEGRKTQTRRVIKLRPRKDGPKLMPELFESFGGVGHACPLGAPGDRLWVKESWAIDNCGRNVSVKPEAWSEGFPIKRLRYIATDTAPAHDKNEQPYWWNRRPSLFMPRWASRISLEIKSVRAERLNDISADDVRAEGVDVSDIKSRGRNRQTDCMREFRQLWRSINGEESWDQNPWVWVIEFKLLAVLSESGSEK